MSPNVLIVQSRPFGIGDALGVKRRTQNRSDESVVVARQDFTAEQIAADVVKIGLEHSNTFLSLLECGEGVPKRHSHVLPRAVKQDIKNLAGR